MIKKRWLSAALGVALVGGIALAGPAQAAPIPVDNDPATTTAAPLASCPRWDDASYQSGSLTFWKGECGTAGVTQLTYGFSAETTSDPKLHMDQIANTLNNFLSDSGNSAIQWVNVAYNHETNGNWFPWSCKSPATFRDDLVLFVDGMRSRLTSASNARVRFSLALNNGTASTPMAADKCGGTTGAQRGHPDDYWDSRMTSRIDHIGVSIYGWDNEVTWQYWTHYNNETCYPGVSGCAVHPVGLSWWNTWAGATGRAKPIGLNEWGSGQNGTENPIYMGLLNQQITYFNSIGRLRYHAYLEGGSHGWVQYNPNLNATDWTAGSGWTNGYQYTYTNPTCTLENDVQKAKITAKDGSGNYSGEAIVRNSGGSAYVSTGCGAATKLQWWVYPTYADQLAGTNIINSGTYIPANPGQGITKYHDEFTGKWWVNTGSVRVTQKVTTASGRTLLNFFPIN